jgi:hypothetical protein
MLSSFKSAQKNAARFAVYFGISFHLRLNSRGSMQMLLGKVRETRAIESYILSTEVETNIMGIIAST